MIVDNPAVVRPAQRLADRLVESLDLQVPVDVRSLADAYADVEEFEGPDRPVDAVLHGLAGERAGHLPLLLLNISKPLRRIRFTLGHELGHLLLPWHLGTIECQVSDGQSTDEQVDPPASTVGMAFGAQEQEADDFASRLLVPRRFIQALHAASADVEEMFVGLAGADVSAEAGLRALTTSLPPGYLFAMLEPGRRTVYQWFASHGTASKGISRGSPLDTDSIERGAVEAGYARHQGRLVAYARYPEREEISAESGDWREALLEILGEVRGEPVGGRTWSQVNGVAASANSSLRTVDTARLAAFMRERFLAREDLADIVAHPRFTEYLQRRAVAFTSAE